MTSPTRYRCVHSSGDFGPSFEFATLAAFWIIQQKDMMEWSWIAETSEAK